MKREVTDALRSSSGRSSSTGSTRSSSSTPLTEADLERSSTCCWRTSQRRLAGQDLDARADRRRPGADRPRRHGSRVRGAAAQADDPAARREPARAGARRRRVPARRPGHRRRRPRVGDARVLDRGRDGRDRRRRAATPAARRPEDDAVGAGAAVAEPARRSTCRRPDAQARRRRARQLARARQPTRRSDALRRRRRAARVAARAAPAAARRADAGRLDGDGPDAVPAPAPTDRRGGRRPCWCSSIPDDDGEARVVLTERADPRRRHHSGEVSFPGGKAEPEDADLVATALREAAEEVGLDAGAAGVRVVGLLDRFWIPVSDFAVTPVVAVADRRPVLVASAGRGGPHRRAAASPCSCPAPPIAMVERTIGGWPLRYGAYDGRRPVGLGRDGPDPRASSARCSPRASRAEAEPRPGPSCAARVRPARRLAWVAGRPARRCPLPDRRRAPRAQRRVAPALEPDRPRRVVGAGELDDERAHLGVLGPGRVDDVGRPEPASPAAIRVRSSPTPTQPPPSMTMNQVVFGLACGSIRAPRAKASSADRRRAPSEWMTWPVSPIVPGRAVRPPMADAEAADLDRHRGCAGASGGGAAAPAAAAAPDRRLRVGELLLA